MNISTITELSKLDPPDIKEARSQDREKRRKQLIKKFLRWAKKERWAGHSEEKIIVQR